MASKNSMPMHTLVALVTLGAIWGGAFTLMKVLVDDLSPVEMAAGRLALGAAAVATWLAVIGKLRWPGRELIVPIGAVALLDTLIPYMLVGWATARIESGVAAVLISVMPLFTVIIAAGVLRTERVGPTRLVGLTAGFAGVLVLIGGPSAIADSGALGQLAVLGAALSYAIGALYARTLLSRVEAGPFTATKLGIGAVVAAGAMVATGGGAGFGELSGGHVAALVALGVVSTGVSFVLYFRIVQEAGTVAASTVTYIIPVFALIFGAAFLEEAIGVSTVAGMGLIATGVAGVMYGPAIERALRWASHRHRAAAPA